MSRCIFCEGFIQCNITTAFNNICFECSIQYIEDNIAMICFVYRDEDFAELKDFNWGIYAVPSLFLLNNKVDNSYKIISVSMSNHFQNLNIEMKEKPTLSFLKRTVDNFYKVKILL